MPVRLTWSLALSKQALACGKVPGVSPRIRSALAARLKWSGDADREEAARSAICLPPAVVFGLGGVMGRDNEVREEGASDEE